MIDLLDSVWFLFLQLPTFVQGIILWITLLLLCYPFLSTLFKYEQESAEDCKAVKGRNHEA